jgi:hypothetical protein
MGGEVVVLVRMASWTARGNRNQTFADGTPQIWVRDAGAGASEIALEHGRKRGVGLANVEQRIRRHFGESAIFSIRNAPGIGTTVALGLPISLSSASASASSVTNNLIEFRRNQG